MAIGLTLNECKIMNKEEPEIVTAEDVENLMNIENNIYDYLNSHLNYYYIIRCNLCDNDFFINVDIYNIEKELYGHVLCYPCFYAACILLNNN